MATERQILANQQNSKKSSGPSEAGKLRSRLNSTKHGMAGKSAEVEAGLSNEFEDRREKWAAEQNPVGEGANWALDQAVAATLRIERCQRTMDDLTATVQERARLTWDEDRAVEAALVASRLDRDPVLASRQLRTTLAGVVLLIEAWLGLVASLKAGKDWSESEASRALDLLGVAADARSGRTLIDDPDGVDPIAFRLELAFHEFDRLEAFRDQSLIPLDEMDRRQAMAGDIAMLSKPAKLVLRYERDAWKRFRDSMKAIKDQAAPPVVAEQPRPKAEAKVRELVATAPAQSLEEERRAMRTEASAMGLEANDPLISMDLDDAAWLEELERRIESLEPLADGAQESVGRLAAQ
jgi:hypothetical protein